MALWKEKSIHLNLIMAAIILILAMAGGFYAGQTFRVMQRVTRPVFVGNIPFQGMTVAEARRALEVFADKVSHYPLQLEYAGDMWTIFPKEVSFSIDVTATLREVMKAGSPSILPFKGSDRDGTPPLMLRPVYTLDEGALMRELEGIGAKISLPPTNAFLIIGRDDKIKIGGGTAGYALDLDETKNEIIEALMRIEGRKVSLVTKRVEPAVSVESLRGLGIEELISSYSTRFRLEEENRNYNISVAAELINGTLLAPGEVFSFNRVVGPRDGSSPFREAPQIVGDELMSGTGGGICQVSTTLYNAALLANLGIVERHKHSIPVGYVPIGQDATVAYNYLDLKFKNTREEHLLITAGVSGEIVTVKIYGRRVPGMEVEILPLEKEVLYGPPATGGDIQAGAIKDNVAGYRVVMARIVKKNGVEVSREIISEDTYRLQPQKRTR